MLRNQKQNRKRLSVSIVMGLCALAITSTVMGDIQSGTTNNVEWYVKVSSLAYDSTY